MNRSAVIRLGRLEYYQQVLRLLAGLRGKVLGTKEMEVMIAVVHFGRGEYGKAVREVLRKRGMSDSNVGNVVKRLREKGFIEGNKLVRFYEVDREEMEFHVKYEVNG